MTLQSWVNFMLNKLVCKFHNHIEIVKHLLIFNVILLICVSGIKSDTQLRSDSPPFLYYYSYTQKAFIIERANGKESRTLANFTPKEGQRIAGDGWSRSGNWFAWYETIPGMVGSGSGEAVIVNRDGSKPFIAKDGCSVAKMSWSPIEDSLLIGCYDVNAGENNFVYYVLDVNSRQSILYINRETLGLTGDIFSITDMEWTPDGQYIVVYYPTSVSQDETVYTMNVYNKNGNLAYKRNFYTANFQSLRPHWSQNGNVAYVSASDKSLIIENVAKNVKLTFDLPSKEVGFVDWAPNGEYAFVYVGSFQNYIEEDLPHPIYLLSIPEKKFKLLSDNGRQFEIQPNGLINFYSANTTWFLSSIHTKGFFVDWTNNVYVVEAPQMYIKQIPLQLDSDLNLYPSFVRWTHKGDKLALLGYDLRTYHGMLYKYDIVSETVTAEKGGSNIVFNNFAYSPNDDFLAFSSNECEGVCIIELNSDNKHSLTFTTSDNRTGPAGELIWHPKNNWILIAGDQVSISRHLNVSNVDGSINRNLNDRCDIVKPCFGWLPE